MRATVVVPTYNEASNLPILVAQLATHDSVANIIVVDDGSPDGTGAIADELSAQYAGRVRAVHRHGPRGYSRATRDGIALALTLPPDVIVQMDADGSHDPRYLPNMLRAIESSDLVIGSRYVPGGSVVNWPLRRRLLSRFANGYVRRILHLRTRDSTSGFRAWRRPLLKGLMRQPRSWSEGYAFLVEMVFLATRAHARITETPIAFVEREHGTSKMSWRVIAESAMVPWQLASEEVDQVEAL